MPKHPNSNRSLFAPRYWPSWIVVSLLRLIALLPARFLIKLGPSLGQLLFRTMSRRRHIAEQNIQRCFASLGTLEQHRLLQDHFIALGIMAMEMLITWWKKDTSIPVKIEINGLEYLLSALEKGKGVLLMSAHFTSLEIGGALLQSTTRLTIHGMYRAHENPVFEAIVKQGRQHWFQEMIPRDDVKSMLRSLKQGLIVWYAPDQAYTGRNSIQSPFFGYNVATNPGTSRIARLSGAPVIPYFPIRHGTGLCYTLNILPPLTDFPSEDTAADTERINQLIEEQVRKYPEQYYWVHRRFKGSE